MSCCGKKRLQWQQYTLNQTPQKVTQEPVLEKPVEVLYRGSGSYLVTGKQTGNVYLFGDKEPRLMVDNRDVAFILADTERFSGG